MGIDLQPAATTGAHSNGAAARPSCSPALRAKIAGQWGFGDADIVRLGLHDPSPDEINLLGIKRRLETGRGIACMIPFRNADGNPLMYRDADDGKQHPFLYVRIWDANTEIKYLQRKGSGCHAYLMPGLDWAAILKDSSRRRLVTEGWADAVQACKSGLTAIGICGQDMIDCPELEPPAAEWKDCQTIYIADADAAYSAQSNAALDRFGSKYTGLGAKVSIGILPGTPDGKKVGLAEFLRNEGVSAFHKLRFSEFRQGDPMRSVNARAVLVRSDPLTWYDIRDHKLRKLESIHNLITDAYWAETDKSGPALKKASRLWVANEAGRREVKGIDYLPSREDRSSLEPVRLTPDGNINMWPGWGCRSEEGDTSWWDAYLEWVFPSHTAPEYRRWFEQWCAFPIREPGAHSHSAPLFVGRHGSGKSMSGLLLKRVHGALNFIEITAKQLRSDFNSYGLYKTLILANEIADANRRVDGDYIKTLVTDEDTKFNIKYLPQFTLPNRQNYIFTSNHKRHALKIEGTERRYFVWEFPAMDMPAALRNSIFASADKHAHALRWRFEHLKGMENYDRYARPPETEALARMQESSKNDAQACVEEFAKAALVDRDKPCGHVQCSTLRDISRQPDWFCCFDVFTLPALQADIAVRLRRAGKSVQRIADSTWAGYLEEAGAVMLPRIRRITLRNETLKLCHGPIVQQPRIWLCGPHITELLAFRNRDLVNMLVQGEQSIEHSAS